MSGYFSITHHSKWKFEISEDSTLHGVKRSFGLRQSIKCYTIIKLQCFGSCSLFLSHQVKRKDRNHLYLGPLVEPPSELVQVLTFPTMT